jgi:hypothetical protein
MDWIYCIFASCYIRLTLNICSFDHQCYIDGQKNKYSVWIGFEKRRFSSPFNTFHLESTVNSINNLAYTGPGVINIDTEFHLKE